MKRLIFSLLVLLGLGAAPAMAAQCDGIFPPLTACATVAGGIVGPVPFASIAGGITLGTMASQNANAVAITGGTITGLGLPMVSTEAASKAYVDNSITGLIIHSQALLATAVALPANTYNNGTAGVGATLTGNSNGALTVDGVLTTTSARIVVKNETSTCGGGGSAGCSNGIYVVTTVGNGGTPYVLTRATDANTPGTNNPMEIGFGTYVFVTNGTANSDTGWSVNSTVTTIGTDAINWAQFSVSGSGATVPGGGTGNTSFTANLPILGNGTSALIQGTVSGNTTKFVTSTGALTSGHCVSIDGNGNYIDAGGACTTGGGGGTVAAGTANQLAYYATSGTTVSGNGAVTWTSPQLSVAATSASLLVNDAADSRSMTLMSNLNGNAAAIQWSNGTGTPWVMFDGSNNSAVEIFQSASANFGINTTGALTVNSSNGTAGQCLQSNGASSAAAWANCGGAGGVTSVSNPGGDGSLTVSPTTGNVLASINPAHANTWSASQTFVSGLIINPPNTSTTGGNNWATASTLEWSLVNNLLVPHSLSIYDAIGNKVDLSIGSNGNMALMQGGGNVTIGGSAGTSNLYVGGGSPWVDVKSGANGCAAAAGNWNGSTGTDDYAAIQCQINYMTSTYGAGIVFLPCGQYKIGTTLTVTVPIILQGAGQGCSYINTAGVDLMALKFSSSAGQQLHGGIRELSIYGYQNSAAGQYLVEVDNFVELTFQNFTLNGGFYALFICGTGSGGGYATCSTAPHSGLHDLGADNTFMNGRIEGWGTLGGAIESYNGANWFYDIKADNDGQTNKYAIYFHTDNVLVAAGQVAESDFFRIDLSGTYTNGSFGLNDATGTASIIVMNHGIFGATGGFGDMGTFRALSLIGSELGQGSVGITSGNLMVTGSMAGNGNAGATISFSGGSTRACAGNFGVSC